MYQYVPRPRIIESLRHLRELFRQNQPINELDRLEAEKREVVAKYLISNLPRLGEHPTLKSLVEVAETFHLTLGGTHQLFGYDLETLRKEELQCNMGRTHIVESYAFDRDQLIDVPAELAPENAFRSDALLSDLVRRWQPPVSIGAFEKEMLKRAGRLYVHVGTEDSERSNLPPGSMALVEPVDPVEADRPNPKFMYLLQFGNGYRCSRCVVSYGKLQMLTSPGKYVRAREFAYPEEVRVAGRIRVFVHQLPQPTYQLTDELRSREHCADLILPSEQHLRHELFLNEFTRFQRRPIEEKTVRDHVEALLHSPLTQRTERRYRRAGRSEPHISTLIQLTLLYFVCYSDALRTSGSRINKGQRYTLNAMLRTENIDDLRSIEKPQSPKPQSVWNAQRREFLDRIPLLSFKFPDFNLRQTPILRLSLPCHLRGIEPPLTSGSWMLLKPATEPLTIQKSSDHAGWERPLYVLRRGLKFITGYLDSGGDGLTLLSNATGTYGKEPIGADEVAALQQVVGVTVPV